MRLFLAVLAGVVSIADGSARSQPDDLESTSTERAMTIRPVPPIPAAPPGSERLTILITIDVETSSGCVAGKGCFPPPIEDMILGEQDGRAYGTPMIMDLLEKHRLRGTFFVNAYLDSYYPESAVRDVVAEIVRRGHDVQFHAHEEFRCFRDCSETDMYCRKRCISSESRLVGSPLHRQLEILSEGVRNIERWSGRRPVAFRGGGWGADGTTLQALRELDIPLDFSLNGTQHELAAQFPVNRVATRAGITEVPAYHYQQGAPFRMAPRHWDVESGTLLEHEWLLRDALRNGVKTAVLVMHSFSFCRRDVLCPNLANIQRFDRLLAHVAAHPRMQVVTAREFLGRHRQDAELFEGSGFVPTVGYPLIVYRSYVQFGESWRHALFFSAHVVAGFFLLLVLALLVRLSFPKVTRSVWRPRLSEKPGPFPRQSE